MNILILNWKDLRNPDGGGAEVFVHELARYWTQWGHDVTLFTRSFDGAHPTEDFFGLQIIRRGNRHTVYYHAKRWLRRMARGYDIIFESVNTRPFFAHRSQVEVPTIALFHQTAKEIWRFELPLPLALLGRYILEPRWLRAYRNQYVLANSASTAEDLQASGFKTVHIVPIGTSTTDHTSLPAKERVPTLIFVGRLAANKRPDHAVEAFRRVRALLPDAVLWVVGTGPMESKLRQEAPPGTTFFGSVTEEQKYDLMARAHLLVVTSVREGWGLIVTEAASVGTLPVGYRVPGLRDSIEATKGISVEPDVDSLSHTLINTLNSPLWRTFVPKEPTSWETCARECLSHIERRLEGQLNRGTSPKHRANE